VVPLQRPSFVSQPQYVLHFFILILRFFIEDLIFLLSNTENPSNPLILRRTACMESFFLFAGAFLFDEKIRQGAPRASFRTIWETPNRPPNIKCMFPHFLEAGS
jgi:hypothetical protein